MWYKGFGTFLCAAVIAWCIVFAIVILITFLRQIRRTDIEKRTNKWEQEETPIPKGKHDKK